MSDTTPTPLPEDAVPVVASEVPKSEPELLQPPFTEPAPGISPAQHSSLRVTSSQPSQKQLLLVVGLAAGLAALLGAMFGAGLVLKLVHHNGGDYRNPPHMRENPRPVTPPQPYEDCDLIGLSIPCDAYKGGRLNIPEEPFDQKPPVTTPQLPGVPEMQGR